MTDHTHNPSQEVHSAELLSMATEIVSAYLSNNVTDTDRIPDLIKNVYATLLELSRQQSMFLPDRPEPFVPIEDSVQDDYIICLEDGRQMKMLKRYLRTAHNMTPDQYRERWGLPSDYPMVAPNYTKRRSNLAIKIGLGHQRHKKGSREAA